MLSAVFSGGSSGKVSGGTKVSSPVSQVSSGSKVSHVSSPVSHVSSGSKVSHVSSPVSGV